MTEEKTHDLRTLEDWARRYIETDSLSVKFAPPPVPDETESHASALRLSAPGRPRAFRVTWEKYKAPKSAHALSSPAKRAHLLHTFLHHELQAAELMCWAVLAFPDTPLAFRRGLVGICQDEIRHMNRYAEHIRALGFDVGDFPVRDWFWERAPKAESPLEFVALMGLGFEAGNLDHTQRFAEMFREAGDAAGAALQDQVGAEEIGHVAFGAHWFRVFAGPLTFERWSRALPAPLSPMLMRGKPLNRGARRDAGMDGTFLDELEAWRPDALG